MAMWPSWEWNSVAFHGSSLPGSHPQLARLQVPRNVPQRLGLVLTRCSSEDGSVAFASSLTPKWTSSPHTFAHILSTHSIFRSTDTAVDIVPLKRPDSLLFLQRNPPTVYGSVRQAGVLSKKYRAPSRNRRKDDGDASYLLYADLDLHVGSPQDTSSCERKYCLLLRPVERMTHARLKFTRAEGVGYFVHAVVEK